MKNHRSAFRQLSWILLSAATLLATACGGGGGADSATTPAATTQAEVATLQWVTAAPLFTANGQQHSLKARALDANGQVLDVPITWKSSAPNVVQVNADASSPSATLTSQTSQGAAQVTASAGDKTITAVAVVSTPAAGTVVLADAQIDGDPQAAVGTAALRVGSTYTVKLLPGIAIPVVGQLVMGQGSKAIAGEVVAVNGRELTLAMVPLQRLLPQLQLDLDLPLTAGAPRTKPQSAVAKAVHPTKRALAALQGQTSFSVAGFDCDAEGSAGGVELAKKDVAPTGLGSLRYRVLWNNDRKLLRLSGQPGVQFELEPTASVAFTGKVDCKLELADVPIPLPPSIGLFLGVGFPVGVGFTMEGALPVNGVALNLKGQAQADVVVGFDCNPGCGSLNSITPTGSVTPTLTAPEFTANSLDLSGQVYAWGNFEGGARWSSALQFDAIEAQAGLKFATKVATENAQAKDAASAGNYALTFEASAGPTEALDDFAGLVGLILDKAKLETSVPLGRSPTAALAIGKASFKAGDDVSFQVDLNADEVLFPLQGYNVQTVRIYRKTVADDGSYVLVLANEQRASSGQTQFTIPWLATVDSGSNISFVAFVQTKLLSGLRWQVGLVNTQVQANNAVTSRNVFLKTSSVSGTGLVDKTDGIDGLGSSFVRAVQTSGSFQKVPQSTCAASTEDTMVATGGALALSLACSGDVVGGNGFANAFFTIGQATTVTVTGSISGSGRNISGSFSVNNLTTNTVQIFRQVNPTTPALNLTESLALEPGEYFLGVSIGHECGIAIGTPTASSAQGRISLAFAPPRI